MNLTFPVMTIKTTTLAASYILHKASLGPTRSRVLALVNKEEFIENSELYGIGMSRKIADIYTHKEEIYVG